jgi:peroxiredoxin
MTLHEELAEFTSKSASYLTPERASVYTHQAEALVTSDILRKALRTGDAAPLFELPDAHGTTVRLEDLLLGGPVILSFYRGSWCPYCNLELQALQRELDNVTDTGAQLVAVSPNKPDVSADLVEKLGLSFAVLSDIGSQVADAFGIAFEVLPELRELYEAAGRNLGEMNGSEEWVLPVPATYVIDQTGTIRYDFVELDYRKRAEPSEVVAAAASLTALA